MPWRRSGRCPSRLGVGGPGARPRSRSSTTGTATRSPTPTGPSARSPTTRPSGPLGIGGVVAEVAMQDADQPIAQGAQGLMVGGASGALLVVVGPGARRAGKRAEGPQVAGVGEALGAGGAGQHDLAGARGAGDGAVPA